MAVAVEPTFQNNIDDGLITVFQKAFSVFYAPLNNVSRIRLARLLPKIWNRH